MDLKTAFSEYLPLVASELEDLVREQHRALAPYYGMMRYHLGWADEALEPLPASSGKRIRPVLCMLACWAAGGDPVTALPAGCALELVHNFSLVHDDIQDRSHVRRGRRAVWRIWGTAHGINVGDGLFVLARLALHRLGKCGLSRARQVDAMLTLDRACLALCEGQFLDMSFEERTEISQDEYLWMIHQKTASLLAAAAQLGAIIATDEVAVVDGCRGFGENLGMAFQIRDDILGIWGDEVSTGKSAATDIRDKKKTLPLVYAMNSCEQPAAQEQLEILLANPAPLSDGDVQTMLQILHQLGVRQHAEKMVSIYSDQALQSLESTGMSRSAQEPLRELAEMLSRRRS